MKLGISQGGSNPVDFLNGFIMTEDQKGDQMVLDRFYDEN